MYVNQNYHALFDKLYDDNNERLKQTICKWNGGKRSDTLKTAERIYEMYFSKVYMYHTVYNLTMLITFLLYFLKLGDTTVHTQKYWKKGLLKSLLSKYL